MSSTTLTRTNSKNAKYKDYVSFLQSYKSGTKDDQNSDISANFSLNNSSNNSSSSVFSDHSDNQPNMRNKLQETLRNLNNNSQSHEGNPSFNKQQNAKVKTEMVIQINSPPEKLKNHTFEVKNVNGHAGEPLLTVSHAAKIFEEKDLQKNGNIHQKISKKNSIGEMTRRFENSNIEDQRSTKWQAQKKNSINDVSKIFENMNNKTHETGTIKRYNNFNSTPKAFTPSITSNAKTSGLKPAITSPKPDIEPPHFFRTNVMVNNHKQSSSNSTVSSLSSLSTSPSPPHSLSPTPPMMCSPPLRVGSPPPLIVTSATPDPYIPPPPPFEDLSRKDMKPNPKFSPSPPKPLLKTTGVSKVPNAPPPPPMPSGGFNQKPNTGKFSISTNQPSDVVDGRNDTINKNDPRVKRAVYGALRSMYGAYHDQANDYIATLPKNRVKKNNKLDGIIESIASQGGLDKVTGRANPNSNKEE